MISTLHIGLDTLYNVLKGWEELPAGGSAGSGGYPAIPRCLEELCSRRKDIYIRVYMYTILY